MQKERIMNCLMLTLTFKPLVFETRDLALRCLLQRKTRKVSITSELWKLIMVDSTKNYLFSITICNVCIERRSSRFSYLHGKRFWFFPRFSHFRITMATNDVIPRDPPRWNFFGTYIILDLHHDMNQKQQKFCL